MSNAEVAVILVALNTQIIDLAKQCEDESQKETLWKMAEALGIAGTHYCNCIAEDMFSEMAKYAEKSLRDIEFGE